MVPTIQVLLSTYNGAKYVREQIESVLAQTGVVVSLLIRDDGSSDSTVSVLKEFADIDDRVSFYQGGNVGPIGSFFDLMKQSGEFDYYAFCDQDDYWDSDKLYQAVSSLERLDGSLPNLYCSNLNVVDEDLLFCRLCHSKPFHVENRYLPLADFFAVGCTEVFNKRAMTLARNHFSSQCLMHDNWLYLICNFFGHVVYDYTPHIQYRQHGGNVVGSKMNRLDQIKDRLKRLNNSGIQPRLQNAIAFMSEFEQQLGELDKQKLIKIIQYKESLFKHMSLLFDFDIRANDIVRDIRYRILILIKRI